MTDMPSWLRHLRERAEMDAAPSEAPPEFPPRTLQEIEDNYIKAGFNPWFATKLRDYIVDHGYVEPWGVDEYGAMTFVPVPQSPTIYLLVRKTLEGEV